VGLYTSPHLLHYNERIQVNRKNISDKEIKALILEIRKKLSSLDKDATLDQKLQLLSEPSAKHSDEDLDRLVVTAGTSGERGFGQIEYDWKFGDKDAITFGPFVRFYNGKIVQTGEPSNYKSQKSEELVGPGIYRTRVDTKTERTDLEIGDRAAGLHWGYLVSLGEKKKFGELELYVEGGVMKTKKITNTTLGSTVSFEDNQGKPIGKSQTATNILKPTEEEHNAGFGDVGFRYGIPTTNIKLGASGEWIEGQEKPTTNLTIGWSWEF